MYAGEALFAMYTNMVGVWGGGGKLTGSVVVGWDRGFSRGVIRHCCVRCED